MGMEINGKHYHDPAIQLREIELAVSRLPIDSTLRPHFEFLIGYIAAQNDELRSLEDMTVKAIEELELEEGSNREEDLEALIAFARASTFRVVAENKELLAATP
jgi:hypothetical protein